MAVTLVSIPLLYEASSLYGRDAETKFIVFN